MAFHLCEFLYVELDCFSLQKFSHSENNGMVCHWSEVLYVLSDYTSVQMFDRSEYTRKAFHQCELAYVLLAPFLLRMISCTQSKCMVSLQSPGLSSGNCVQIIRHCIPLV